MSHKKQRSLKGLAPAAALILLSLAAYAPALRAGFIWDDATLTETAIFQLPGLGGLWHVWTTPSAISFETHYWPLVYTSFWLEFKLWGMQPLGYHLVNILLHGLDGVLLWMVLRRMKLPGAWLGAALFALHPVHVESVAWVIERKDVLSAAFYLAAFLAMMRYEESRKGSWVALAAGGFVCALLSKSVVVTLPVALALWLWWKNGRLKKGDLMALAGLALIAVAITAADMMRYGRIEGPSGVNLSPLERILLAGRALWFYAGKMVWPAHLAALYPHWRIDTHSAVAYVFPCAPAGALLALWALRGRLGRGPLAAALFYGLTLSPILGLIDYGFLRHSFAADRFQYLASIGPIVLLTVPVARGAARLSPAWRRMACGLAATLLLVLGVLTWRQAGYYRDSVTFFTHSATLYPGNWSSEYALGNALVKQRRYEDAQGHLNESLRLKPDFDLAQFDLEDLAAKMEAQQRCGQAEQHYREVLRQNPRDAEALSVMGQVRSAQGRTDEALDFLHQALRLRPEEPEIHRILGDVLIEHKKLGEGMAEYREALRLKPENILAHYRLGQVLAQMEQLDEAARHLSEAARLRPEDGKFHGNLGAVLLEEGKTEEAIVQFREALRIDPRFTYAHYRLGNALQQRGHLEEAIGQYEETLRIDPQYKDAALALQRARAELSRRAPRP